MKETYGIGEKAMTKKRPQITPKSRHKQAGIATLVLVLVVLIGLTAVTFYAADTGIMRQRVVANEIRSKEALQAAEFGSNMAINFIRANIGLIASSEAGGWMQAGAERWISCAGVTSLPCGDGTTNHFGDQYVYYSNGGTTILPISDPLANYPIPTTGDNPFQVHLVAKCADEDDNGTCDSTAPSLETDSLFVAIAEGWSADQTGNATIQQGFRAVKALAEAPDAPLVATGNVDLIGGIEAVTNPNSVGAGVPLTVWTKGNFSAGGAAYSCYIGEFLESGDTYDDPSGTDIQLCDNCTCSAGSETGHLTSNKLGIGPDIVYNVPPAQFPDLFEYTFGIARSDWQTIKDIAEVLPDCTTLDENSTGLYWIEGNCSVTSNQTIGSAAKPVLLVVEDALLRMAGGATVFGLVFVFDKNEDGLGASLDTIGNNQMYGAIVAEGEVDISAGAFIVRYDETVLENVSLFGAGRNIGRMPGTWLDYYGTN